MAEFPAMPLWTDAYLADTSHLTTLEHGAYLLLLMVMWRTRDKSLPDDDKLLARYCKLTPSQWRRMKPIIRDFFTVEGGCWRQSRLTDEANAVKQHRERQAKAGRASALKRKGRHSTTVQPKGNQTPTPTPTPNVSTNVDTPHNPPSKSKPKRASSLPDDFTPSLTQKAQKIVASWPRGMFERELDKFRDHHTAKGSTFKDWQAAFRTWISNADQWSNRNGNGNRGGGNGLLDACTE